MVDDSDIAIECSADSPASGHTIAATADDLIAIDETGGEVWRYPFGPGRPVAMHRATCVYSRDGAVVWLYLPDTLAGRGTEDRLVLLDAATGALLDETALAVPGGGHSASIDLHPDGVHLLLNVACGQDGAYTYLARTTPGPRMAWEPWPADPAALGGLWLSGISADGATVVAVSDDRTRVEFRTWPTGDLAWTVTLADLGYDVDGGDIESLAVGQVVLVADALALIEVRGEQEEPDGDWGDYLARHGADWRTRTVLKQALHHGPA